MAYIYIIRNKINDKVYIGQCLQSVEKRFLNHTHCKDNAPIHKAMRELGESNFYYEVLATCPDEKRLDVETEYILKYNSLIPNGYNYYQHSSNGFTSYSHKDISKQLISTSSKLWWETTPVELKEVRNAKISKALTGKKFSEEHKLKLSMKASQRVGVKNPFYGKHHTDESKAKMRFKSLKYNFLQFTLSGEFIQAFDTIDDVYKYIVQNKLSEAKQSSIQYRIYATVEGRQHSAYGYKWKSRECNDYSNGGEIPQ